MSQFSVHDQIHIALFLAEPSHRVYKRGQRLWLTLTHKVVLLTNSLASADSADLCVTYSIEAVELYSLCVVRHHPVLLSSSEYKRPDKREMFTDSKLASLLTMLLAYLLISLESFFLN